MLPLIALLLLGGPATTSAELYFEQTTVVVSEGHARGPGVRSRVWYSGRKARLEAAESQAGPSLILRLDRGKAYRLDASRKQVTELDLSELRERSRADLGMAGELMGTREPDAVRTTPLRASRRIAGRVCTGYRLSAGTTVLDVYVAEDLGVGIDAFADFLEWSGASESMPGLISALRRLPGFPLETRSRVSLLGEVQETVSSVTLLKVGPQPAELFEPPAGWRVVGHAEN